MGRKYKFTLEERRFCGSLPNEITSVKGREMFYEKYGKRINDRTFRNYRKMYSGDEPPEIDYISEDPYEELAIAIIKQAYFDARVKIKHGDDWTAERKFLEGDFIKKNFAIDGEYITKELKKIENRRGKKNIKRVQGM